MVYHQSFLLLLGDFALVVRIMSQLGGQFFVFYVNISNSKIQYLSRYVAIIRQGSPFILEKFRLPANCIINGQCTTWFNPLLLHRLLLAWGKRDLCLLGSNQLARHFRFPGFDRDFFRV